MVAAARTTAVIPAAADEVSASIAHLMSGCGQEYQALAAQAAAFNDQFVQHLAAAVFSYTDVEAAIAAFLQNLPDFLQFLAREANGLVSFLAITVATTPPQGLLLDLFAIGLLPV